MSTLRHVVAIALPLAMLTWTAPASSHPLATPSAAKSTIDKVIHLIGASSGLLVPEGAYTVTVNDAGATAIGNCPLVLDFSLCGTSDVRIAAGQLEMDLTTNCPVINATTDGNGVFTFRIMGHAQNPVGGAPGIAFPCLQVIADNVVLDPHVTSGPFAGVQAVIVSALDESGSSGFSAGDLSSFTGDYFHSPSTYFARSDFDGNGALTILDLSFQVSALFVGSWTSTAVACP
jgi:hypothetical protein